jgi:hypothetical protein
MAPELQELLRAAAHDPGDHVDLADIKRRAGEVRRTRRGTAAAVVLMVAASTFGAISLVTVERPRNVDFVDRGPDTEQADPPPPRDTTSPWEPLPASPLSARTDAASVWTGSEVLIWGGLRFNPPGSGSQPSIDVESSGAAYDPRRRTWRVLPQAPLEAGFDAPAVWTGHEMIVVGARPRPVMDGSPASPGAARDDLDGGARNSSTSGVAAYNPSTNTWRTLAQPPRPIPSRPSVVWTGTRVLFWGGDGQDDGVASDLGLAYNPTSDSWRELPKAPIAGRYDHAVVWTGREMLVWGGYGIEREDGFHAAGDGAAYDPAADAWRVLPESPLSPRFDPNAAWTGSQMLMVGGGGELQDFVGDAAAYDPVSDAWTSVAQPPRKGYQMFLSTHEGILARGRGGDLSGPKMQQAALYVPDQDKWVLVPDTHAAGDEGAIGVVTDKEVIIWGGGYPQGNEGASVSFALLEEFARDAPVVTATDPDDRRTEGVVAEREPVQEAATTSVWPPSGVSGPWRDDASATAEAFGRKVLGWPRATVGDGEPSEDGMFGVRLTLAERLGGGRTVHLTVQPTSDGADHVITYVGVSNASPFDVEFAVSVRNHRAHVRFLWPRITNHDPLPSADLAIRYSADTAEATTNRWPARFDVDLPFSTDRPGCVLILVRDGQGKVIGAQGIGLPPGDVVTTLATDDFG